MPETRNIIITCEHGGNRIPSAYAALFRHHRQLLDSHRGHDAGSLVLARRLAGALDAPLFFATVSRLLVDLNRSIGHRAVFSEVTRTLTWEQRQQILARYYLPYRNEVEATIARRVASGGSVLHLSVHSFTPAMDGRARNTDVGLLYDPARTAERRVCQQLQGALQSAHPELRVGRNYPYRGTADGFTPYLRRLFPDKHYAGIEIEINQRYPLGEQREWRRLQSALSAACQTLKQAKPR